MIVFPQELVDDILDYSAGDLRSLKACSLVSREWVSRCRFHLFEKCALWPSRIASFGDLLRSPNCTFLPYVRSINNIKHYGPQDYDVYDEIAADLSRLVNVRELEMEFTTHYRPEKLDTFLRTAFPNITRLVVDLSRAPRPAPLANMICLFPALQELDMEMTTTLEDIPAEAVLPRELHSLRLSENSAGQILTWLDAAGHLPNVHSLKLPCLRAADIPIVHKALQQIGGELHHLDVTVRCTSEYDTDDVQAQWRMFDLFLHPNLETLRIHDDSWSNDEAQSSVPWIPKVLMKLAAPALESLTLEFDLSCPAYEKLDWAAVDAFLSSARFTHLQNVVVKCEQHGKHDYDPYFDSTDPDQEPEIDYEHHFVCKALPLLANSLLRTEW